MASDNAEQVAKYDRRAGRLVLRDGTEIVNAYSVGIDRFEGWRFDQIILADDRRMEIIPRHRRTIIELLRRCERSIIPEEFTVQIYDIDEEAPT